MYFETCWNKLKADSKTDVETDIVTDDRTDEQPVYRRFKIWL